jgi:hypothetical protein
MGHLTPHPRPSPCLPSLRGALRDGSSHAENGSLGSKTGGNGRRKPGLGLTSRPPAASRCSLAPPLQLWRRHWLRGRRPPVSCWQGRPRSQGTWRMHPGSGSGSRGLRALRGLKAVLDLRVSPCLSLIGCEDLLPPPIEEEAVTCVCQALEASSPRAPGVAEIPVGADPSHRITAITCPRQACLAGAHGCMGAGPRCDAAVGRRGVVHLSPEEVRGEDAGGGVRPHSPPRWNPSTPLPVCIPPPPVQEMASGGGPDAGRLSRVVRQALEEEGAWPSPRGCAMAPLPRSSPTRACPPVGEAEPPPGPSPSPDQGGGRFCPRGLRRRSPACWSTRAGRGGRSWHPGRPGSGWSPGRWRPWSLLWGRGARHRRRGRTAPRSPRWWCGRTTAWRG